MRELCRELYSLFVLPVGVTKLNWFWFQLGFRVKPTRFSCLDRPVRPTDRPARPPASPAEGSAIADNLISSSACCEESENLELCNAMQDLVVLAIRTDHLFSSCSALEAVILRLLKL
jgi:hypothetical protein